MWTFTGGYGCRSHRFLLCMFRILNWRYWTIIYIWYKTIFCGDIPLHRPHIGLIYGGYLQMRIRFLKWPCHVWPHGGIHGGIHVLGTATLKRCYKRIHHEKPSWGSAANSCKKDGFLMIFWRFLNVGFFFLWVFFGDFWMFGWVGWLWWLTKKSLDGLKPSTAIHSSASDFM